MKNLFVMMLMSASAALLAGVSTQAEPKTTLDSTSSASDISAPSTQPTTAPSDKPVNQFCAVMQNHKISEGVTTEYKGKIIGFCCESCIPKFEANPDKYLPTMK